MNKTKINIVNILRNAPVGTRLYCTMLGWINFKCIDTKSEYPIICMYNNGSSFIYFTKYGYYYNSDDAECVLFPSDTLRTWDITHYGTYGTFIASKFDKTTLKPFDKVLVRDSVSSVWQISFFSSIDDRNVYRCINACPWTHCIPYNDRTKYLLNTSNEEPDYYKCDKYI